MRPTAFVHLVRLAFFVSGLAMMGSSIAGDLEDALAAFADNDCTGATRKARMAAEQGNARAAALLGGMYRTGRCLDQSHAEAYRWYKISADQGELVGLYSVGGYLIEGEDGVEAKPEEGRKWLLLAAERGHVEAANLLGAAYNMGVGGATDVNEAAKWFGKAASMGHPLAAHSLGAMYYKGSGVEQNYVLAYAWSHLAAERGHKDAGENRDFFARRMSKSQIAVARGIAARCKARGYKDCRMETP